jgi:hypothetical protein
MKVYEHNDPDSFILRSHPWIDGESDPAHRYYDFRTSPELIRSSLEDLQAWSTYPATETFYRLLEWLNGAESVFESNDCAFSGASANTSAQFFYEAAGCRQYPRARTAFTQLRSCA